MNRHALTTLAALALGIVLARPACGQAVHYSNLGHGDAYANNIRWNVFGTYLGGAHAARGCPSRECIRHVPGGPLTTTRADRARA